MTKQTRIPVPPVSGQAKDQGTLIERVVRNYDLVRVTAAPIPDDLIPPAGKRRRYRRSEPLAEVVEVAEVAEVAEVGEVAAAGDAGRSADAAAPVDQAAVPEPQPEVVTPEVLSQPPVAAPVATTQPPARAVAGSALVAPVQPVQFKGPSHRVSRQHLRELGLIEPEAAVTALLEEFRIVKRQLLFNAGQLQQQGMGYAAQRVLICSPHPGEGKTFTAVNLALAIAAEKETEVVLVDADFAKPSVLSSLGLPGGKGLMDALSDPSIDVADCVLGTDISGLWVLPAGSATTSDSEYLASSRTRQVLDRLIEVGIAGRVDPDRPDLAARVDSPQRVAFADRTFPGRVGWKDVIVRLRACEATAPWEEEKLTGAFVQVDVQPGGPHRGRSRGSGRWSRPRRSWRGSSPSARPCPGSRS